MVAVDPPATVATRVDERESSARGERHLRRIAGLRSRADGQGREVLVELQRADRCGVAELQIVPRPAGPDALIVETLVVADDPAVDLAGCRPLAAPPPIRRARPRRAGRAC